MNAQLRAAQRFHDAQTPDDGDTLAEDIYSEYVTDDAKILEAAQLVTESDAFIDNIAADIARTFGLAETQTSRDLRLGRELREMVEARLEAMADEAAFLQRDEAELARGEAQFYAQEERYG